MPKQNKTPSIIIDPTVLGDRLPRDEDSIAQKLEETIDFREKKHQIQDHDILKNVDMALGGPLDPKEFIRRLWKMEPRLLIEPGGYSNCVRIGIPTVDDDPLSPTHGQLVPTWLSCGFPIDVRIQEFDHSLDDKYGIAVRTVRGWRTVLLRLILSGAVTYQQAIREFGEPHGERSILWKRQLQGRA